MSSWEVQDASVRFTELLQATIQRGPQALARGRVEVAVLVPIQEWRRLQNVARPDLKTSLLAPSPRFDNDVVERRALKRRRPNG
jgi:antitoxin Phd